MGKPIDKPKSHKFKLRQILERVAMAERAANAGSWDWDFESNQQYWSEQLFAVLGLDAQKTTPSFEVWRNLVHPEDYPQVHQAFTNSIDHQQPYAVIYRIVRPSGAIRWLSVHGQAYYNPAGTPIRFTGICFDITESRKNENLIVESDQRFRNLFEHLPLAYQSLDIEGNWLDCNQHMADLLGFESPAQMIGLSFIDYLYEFPPVQFHEVYDQFKAVNTVNRETIVRRVDGQLRTVTISGQTQRDNQDRFMRTHCIVTDITERHSQQQQVLKQKAQLEVAVAENTQALIDSERYAKQILECCPVAILVVDSHGIILETNQKAGELFGCHAPDLIGRLADKHISFAPGPKNLQNWAALAEHAIQLPGNQEIQVTTFHGNEIHVEVGLGSLLMGHKIFIIAALNDITSRKQAEYQLQETRDILERAQAVAKVGSWQCIDNNNLFKISKEAARIFGFGNQYLINAAERLAKVYPDDRLSVESAWQSALLGNPYNIVYRIVVENEIKWIHSIAQLTIDEFGGCTGSMGTVQDITELTIAQQALEHQRFMLETLLDSSPNGLALFDNRNNLVKCNQKYLDFIGYPRELVEQGKVNTHDFLTYFWHHGEFKGMSFDEVKVKFTNLINSRQSFEEFRELSNGHSAFVQTLFLADNWFLVSYNDVTHIKQVEKKNWEMMQSLMLATKASGIGVWIWNMPDNSVHWDSRMYEIYGVEQTGQAITYHTWASRLHPEDAQETQAALQVAAEQGTEFSKTFRIVRPNGQIRYIGSNSTLEFDADGKPVKMIGTNSDITSFYDQQAVLQAAKQAADAASNAKSLFLANVSHEIRTPLNGIIGLSELLQQSELSQQQSQFASKIYSSGKTLLNLINDILDFSKIEAGHLTLTLQPFSLIEVLEKSLDLFYIAIKEKNLSVVTDVADNIPARLIGDGLRLGQVLNNLLGNAVKFTQQGNIAIKIENISTNHDKLSVADNGARVQLRFSVSDSGIGLSELQQQQLFKSFVQADNTISQRFGGTGLGLAISKNLVQMMSGDINVTSELGKGSTFVFTAWFGCYDQQVMPADNNIRYEPAGAIVSAVDLSDADILVVDDNRINQLVARGFLEKMQLRVTVANNGLDAIEWVRKHHFDAILMDIQMPGMNGYETTQQIRSLPEGQHIPIIALTATVTEECIEASRLAGMNDHLPKPLDSAQLKDCLANWLAHK